MINDPNFKKTLIVSILTSVIVLIIIDPLLKLAATWLMWLGTNLSASWTDHIYKSAALGLREKFSFLLLLYFFAMCMGISSGILTAIVLARKEKSKTTLKSWIEKPAFIILSALLLIVVAVEVLASNFAELQLNASFNQRITVLAAKASEQQIKDLRASWALMSGRKDYESINMEIQRIEGQLKVKLPLPLWE